MKRTTIFLCLMTLLSTSLLSQAKELTEPIDVTPQVLPGSCSYRGNVGEYQLLCFNPASKNTSYALFKPNEQLVYPTFPSDLPQLAKAKTINYLFSLNDRLYFAMLVKNKIWIVQFDNRFHYVAHIETDLKKDDNLLSSYFSVLRLLDKDGDIRFVYSYKWDYTSDGRYAGSYYYAFCASFNMATGAFNRKQIFADKKNVPDMPIPVHFSPSGDYMALFDSHVHTYSKKERPNGTKIRFKQDEYFERVLICSACQLRILNMQGEELRRWKDTTDYYILDNIHHFCYSCIGITDEGTAIVLTDSMQVTNTYRKRKDLLYYDIKHDFSSPNSLGIYYVPVEGDAEYKRIADTKLPHIAHYMDCKDNIKSLQDSLRVIYSPYDITVSYQLLKTSSAEMYLDMKNNQVISFKALPSAPHEKEYTLFEDKQNKKSYFIGYERSEDCYYLMIYNRDNYTYEEIPICKNLNRYANQHYGFYLTADMQLFRIQDKRIWYYPISYK